MMNLLWAMKVNKALAILKVKKVKPQIKNI